MNTYEKIISLENIRNAYLDVVRKFEEEKRTRHYRGNDALSLSNYDLNSEELCRQIQSELISLQDISPARECKIPKRHKLGYRLVYIHSIKERIKAQAVYRIVYRLFDSYFSNYLYSYRKKHPHYQALRTVIRAYKKDQNKSVLIGDISNYSDILDTKILKQKIKNIGMEDRVNELLFLYVDMQTLINGFPVKKQIGILTGLPITVLFNNLYLDEFDKKFGKECSLYRRVGDDFIVFDTLENLKKNAIDMELFLKRIRIQKKDQKINLQKKNSPFTFLGHFFNNQKISIPKKSLLSIQEFMRSRLRYSAYTSIGRKLEILEKKFIGKQGFEEYFVVLVKQYPQVNNRKQIRFIDDYFFIRLVIFLFGSYSKRNHFKTVGVLRNMFIPKLTRYHQIFHSGVIDIEKLKKKAHEQFI